MAKRTLADVLAEHEIDPVLYEPRSGKPMTDEDGVPDDPREYRVLQEVRVGGYTYLAVQSSYRPDEIDAVHLHDGCTVYTGELPYGRRRNLEKWIDEISGVMPR